MQSIAISEPLLPHLSERVCRTLGAGELAGDLVVYWMHGALRAHENPSLDVARELAYALDLPLLVFQALGERYPWACDRFHVFALEGAREVAAACGREGLAHAFHLERPGHRWPVLRELAARAAVVVTDEVPIEPFRGWTRRLAAKTGTTVVTVDAACVAPMPLVKERPERAFAFRRAAERLHDARLAAIWPESRTPVRPYEGPLPFEPLDLAAVDLHEAVAACDVDHSIAPVPGMVGGSRAGYERWNRFRDLKLNAYARDRNDPLRDGVSRLSPYLHFGMVSPLRIAREAAQRGTKGAEKYLDELLVWRELAWSFCYHTDDVDALGALPGWARATLAEHDGDDRPTLDAETLERGRTGDELWDAMQRSLLVRGELHNNLRMTWGKAFLGWSRDAEQALARTVDLNHRFAYDGRDPSSYGGILWCFGRFDRPFPPAAPVRGTLRPRPTAQHAERLDVERYSASVSEPPAGPARFAVVGAGVAGLAAARTLADAGHEVVVLERDERPGGRLASRRSDPFTFDHGAQYFTARDGRFRRRVDAWVERGLVRRWPDAVAVVRDGQVVERDEDERFVAVPTMDTLVEHLVRDLTVRTDSGVEALERTAQGWTPRDAGGDAYGAFRGVVLAVPPARAASLLGEDGSDRPAYDPCWSAMLGFAERLDVDFDAAHLDDLAVRWAARDSSKPGRPDFEAWVVNATPEWTRAHERVAPTEAAERLAHALARALGIELPELVRTHAHLWREALPAEPRWSAALPTTGPGLALADDADGGRVEAAWLSGVAAAGRLLGELAREAAGASESRARRA